MNEGALPIVAEIIRSKSRSGELADKASIIRGLVNRGLPVGDGDDAQRMYETAIESALEAHNDLKRLHGADGGQRFFSSRFMTEAYAGILLNKGSDPLALITKIVRDNSALYPRPTPLDTFENPPFDLTREEIDHCLNRMADHEEYRDIETTRSSLGTVFLYSAAHLEAGYASMLAEWTDAGQADNP